MYDVAKFGSESPFTNERETSACSPILSGVLAATGRSSSRSERENRPRRGGTLNRPLAHASHRKQTTGHTRGRNVPSRPNSPQFFAPSRVPSLFHRQKSTPLVICRSPVGDSMERTHAIAPDPSPPPLRCSNDGARRSAFKILRARFLKCAFRKESGRRHRPVAKERSSIHFAGFLFPFEFRCGHSLLASRFTACRCATKPSLGISKFRTSRLHCAPRSTAPALSPSPLRSAEASHSSASEIFGREMITPGEQTRAIAARGISLTIVHIFAAKFGVFSIDFAHRRTYKLRHAASKRRSISANGSCPSVAGMRSSGWAIPVSKPIYRCDFQNRSVSPKDCFLACISQARAPLKF